MSMVCKILTERKGDAGHHSQGFNLQYPQQVVGIRPRMPAPPCLWSSRRSRQACASLVCEDTAKVAQKRLFSIESDPVSRYTEYSLELRTHRQSPVHHG
jgi:hypothetical protein